MHPRKAHDERQHEHKRLLHARNGRLQLPTGFHKRRGSGKRECSMQRSRQSPPHDAPSRCTDTHVGHSQMDADHSDASRTRGIGNVFHPGLPTENHQGDSIEGVGETGGACRRTDLKRPRSSRRPRISYNISAWHFSCTHMHCIASAWA